jgi:hypothetical protein
MKVRVAQAAALAALLAAGGAAGAGFQSPNAEATVSLSTAAAGAQNVGLTVQIPTVLQCGRPTGVPVALSLPGGVRIPRAIPVSAVRVNGVPASKVVVASRVVTVTLPVHRGISCFALIEGRMKIAIAPSAALGNPARAGIYTFGIRQGRTAYDIPVTIKVA